MYINVAVGIVEAAESSFWYINEGNGWNLCTPTLGEIACKGCLCNPWTLKDIFLNFISKLGLIFIHLKVESFKTVVFVRANLRSLKLLNC